MHSSGIRARRLAAAAVLCALALFYYLAASDHARVVNQSRVRADQSGYLWDAVGIHVGRHGGPAGLIGERNRMPEYPWLLSWLYDASMTPDRFFEVAKSWNIRLSMVLLAVMWFVFRRYLPFLASSSLLLVVAFGYFVWKAGYAQVELLYYSLFFMTFVACWRLLESRGARQTLVAAALTGSLAALTHLAKAAVLPLVGCAAVAYVAQMVLSATRPTPNGVSGMRTDLAWRVAGGAVLAATFLGVLSPYLLHSKRVFGQYFYNVNTTFYLWYDDWPAAAAGTYKHGDGVGWPQMPASEIPTLRSYVRSHSPRQIADRLVDGMRDMVVVSYTRLSYFKYVAMYLMCLAVVIATRWRDVRGIVTRHAAVAGFLVMYGLAYLLAVAFYKPISGTTLRMLLAHVAPVLLMISAALWRTPLRDSTWRIAGVSITTSHFHVLVIATVGFDVVFTLWPRMLVEFAGY